MEAERAKEEKTRALARRLASVPGMTAGPARCERGASGEGSTWHLACSVAPLRLDHGAAPSIAHALAEVTTTEDGTHVRIELSRLTGVQAERVLRALVQGEVREPGPSD